jgi:hypothetical protein
MCANYDPSKEIDFEAFSEFPRPKFDYPPETWKDYVAPILRIDGAERLTDPATFGMVPRKHIPPGVKLFDTMNARAESVGEKRSYSGAWKNLQLCLIPCYRLGDRYGHARRPHRALHSPPIQDVHGRPVFIRCLSRVCPYPPSSVCPSVSGHGETFEEVVQLFEANRNGSTAHISPARRCGCERASHSLSGVRLIPGETESPKASETNGASSSGRRTT